MGEVLSLGLLALFAVTVAFIGRRDPT